MKVTGAIRGLHRRKACVVLSGEQALADSSGLKLVGLIFASVTLAVMLTTTIVVKDYADGV
jgi:hypothetical protein